MRRCASEPSISCVLLDAATGDVLALVSSQVSTRPRFSTGFPQALWHELATDPRARSSTRRSAASIRPDRRSSRWWRSPRLQPAPSRGSAITCPGYLEFGDATFHCWRKGGHGTLHLRDAIKKSCDVFFYENGAAGPQLAGEGARSAGWGVARCYDARRLDQRYRELAVQRPASSTPHPSPSATPSPLRGEGAPVAACTLALSASSPQSPPENPSRSRAPRYVRARR